MRIIILAGEIPATTFIDSLINGIASKGHQVMIMGTRRGAFHYHQNVLVRFQPLGWWSKLWNFLMAILSFNFKDLRIIYNHSFNFKQFINQVLFYTPIRQFNPDWVHLQWASMITQRELLFDLFPGKILVSLRGAHINYTPIIKPTVAQDYQKLFPKVTRFHAVSEAIKLEAMKYGAAPEKIQRIYTSVDETLLTQTLQEKPKGDVINIIVVGRFHWVKGYSILMDALIHLKVTGINFKLELIAGKEIPEEIFYAIHQGQLKQYIEVSASLSHDLVLDRIQNADLLILPSLNEGIANVVIEAMALGTPALSSNCGGMAEVINQGVNGLLFENRNAKDLANQILMFSKMNSTRIMEIRKSARETVASRFGRQRMLDEFDNFYSY